MDYRYPDIFLLVTMALGAVFIGGVLLSEIVLELLDAVGAVMDNVYRWWIGRHGKH